MEIWKYLPVCLEDLMGFLRVICWIIFPLASSNPSFDTMELAATDSVAGAWLGTLPGSMPSPLVSGGEEGPSMFGISVA